MKTAPILSATFTYKSKLSSIHSRLLIYMCFWRLNNILICADNENIISSFLWKEPSKSFCWFDEENNACRQLAASPWCPNKVLLKTVRKCITQKQQSTHKINASGSHEIWSTTRQVFSGIDIHWRGNQHDIKSAFSPVFEGDYNISVCEDQVIFG